MSPNGFLTPFLGALQACVCVLLTMCYGVVARRLRLIHDATINDMSGLAVKLFLPALIVVHLGQQLHLGTALNYVPVLGNARPPAEIVLLRMSAMYSISLVRPIYLHLDRRNAPSLALLLTASLGYARMLVQQHDLAAAPVVTVTGQCRLLEAHTGRRRHRRWNRACTELLSRLCGR